MSDTLKNREMRARRALAKVGERLTKIRPNTRDYQELGPYMVVDAYNNGVSWGMTLEQIEESLKGKK